MQRLRQSPREPGFVQDPYPFSDRARALGPLFQWEDYGFPGAAGHDAAGDAIETIARIAYDGTIRSGGSRPWGSGIS